MFNRPFRLGTRRSPLALTQAEEVRARLMTAHGLSAEAIELVTVLASGDRVQDRPLAEIGGKALWTKELDAALLAGEIDFAVHSAKDVETLRPAEIAIAAVLPREDVRDVLVLRQALDERNGISGIAALPPGARVGTSAPRRAAQLLNLRPDCLVVPFRGNVATRLAKLAAGEADATLLAAAGLNRLGESGTGLVLDAASWLPAPGQGAIAVECRALRPFDKLRTQDERADWVSALLAAIDHAPSRATLLAERALLAALGGNCHSAIGVLSSLAGDMLTMRAVLFSPDGAERVEAEATFAAGDSAGPAQLAHVLLAKASPAITAHFTGL